MIRIVQSPFHILGAIPSRSRGFSSCPFRILGLERNRTPRSINPARRGDHNITYEEVRTAFRELALKHHPDTNSNSSSSSREFTRIREAFDAILEGPSGIAMIREEHSYEEQRERDDNEMKVPDREGNGNRNSFQDERNGFLHPSVNPQILHEVAEVAKKLNPGGLDKGGMWQYANMIRNMAKDDSNGLPPLRVDGGKNVNTKETARTGLKRRRRRK